MSDRDCRDESATPEHDPNMSSTWSTIDGTVDASELVDEEDLEALMVEPTKGELGILYDMDVPGEPG
ncbi:MAG: hypothetical protein IT338_09410 [Thermomicrobiales bacterium]|nr:hypothetical protein [Thermomicrobiales bacterium]